MLPEVSFGELKNCPWKSSILNSQGNTCLSYYSSFLSEISKYPTDSSEAKALKLLGSLCSMEFNVETGKEVFIPMFSGPSGRSTLPEDLSDSNIDSLYRFIFEIDDHELKSRIADCIWLKKGNHKFESAKIAFEEYIKIVELLKQSDELEAIKRLLRAAHLSYEIGNAGIEFQNKVFKYIEEYILKGPNEKSNGFIFKLFQEIYDKKMGDLKKISLKCKEVADYHKSVNNFHMMRCYLSLYKNFMKYLNNSQNEVENIDIEIGESFVNEANTSTSSFSKSFHLAKAIEVLRKIPKLKLRVSDLHTLLIYEQKNIIGEMQTLTPLEIDLSEPINESENLVSGLNFIEAIKIFISLIGFPDKQKLYNEALSTIVQHPLSHIFPKTYVNDKGKTVAKINGANLSSLTNSDDVVKSEAYNMLKLKYDMAVHGKILPALKKINEEHLITLEIIQDLIRGNPFIPPEHEFFYIHGLYSGFKLDFVTSSLYLIPQVENSIRYVLETNDLITTSTLSPTGIQNEKSLNVLLEDPNVVSIFGESIVFVLDFLFNNKQGWNLRHLLAHGLISYDELKGAKGIFSWWIILKIIMSPFYYVRDNH